MKGLRDEPAGLLGDIRRVDADNYLRRTFSRAVAEYRPDAVIFLGDLLDEGGKLVGSYQILIKNGNEMYSTVWIQNQWINGINLIFFISTGSICENCNSSRNCHLSTRVFRRPFQCRCNFNRSPFPKAASPPCLPPRSTQATRRDSAQSTLNTRLTRSSTCRATMTSGAREETQSRVKR